MVLHLGAAENFSIFPADRKDLLHGQVVLTGKKEDEEDHLPTIPDETKPGKLVPPAAGKLVKMNCAGEKYIVSEASLANYPDTLLGNPQRRREFQNEKTGECFFDRNQDLFGSILYFYQSPGIFRPPDHIDPLIVEEELAFFELDLCRMAEKYDEMKLAENPIPPPSKMEIINETITNPGFSRAAMIWGAIDMLCIITTISTLVMETIPAYERHFKQPFQTGYKTAIYLTDVFVNAFFTIDLLLKFITSSKKSRFFCNTMNVMDVLAVSPFYVELLVLTTVGGEPPQQFFALKVCRIVRVVRVLKIVRHSKQLTEVMEVVSSAKQEFSVLIGVVGVVILLVGTIMYFIEVDSKTCGDQCYESILHGCWWAIVTITTVGYGDLYPRTLMGRLVGSLVVLFGIVVLAFPMTIIVSKFQDAFTLKKLTANREMTVKLRHMAVSRSRVSVTDNVSDCKWNEEKNGISY